MARLMKFGSASLPPDRSRSLSQTTFLIAFSFTACWYFTSSKNAVATQQLLHQCEIRINDNHEHSPVGIVVALTALQLFVGLIMCMVLLSLISFMKRGSCTQKGSSNKTKEGMLGMISRPEWSKSTSRLAAVGILHFLGCFCTNMGFAFGSASVVQVIKLLEPIETLLLTAIFNVVVLRTWHGITSIKTLSVITIVCGTSLLLLQKSIGQNVNNQSVIFSLLSGMFMASRNVTKKTFNQEKIYSEHKNKEKEWIQAAIDGMLSFCTITAVAAIPAMLFLVVVEMLGSTGMKGGITVWMLKTAGQPGKEAIIFHGLYNIASISVLSLVSAQSHSLLNVGKRISNVITASIIFHESISSTGILGLCVAAIGGIFYSCCPVPIERCHNNTSTKSGGGRRNSFLIIFVISLLEGMYLMINLDGFKNSSSTIMHYSQDIVSVTSPELPVPSPLLGKNVVWMFPFPPKGSHEKISISADETLICAYINACKDYPGHSKINLRELTIGTYYHNYVRDHTYYKVRHMSDFPFHIQAITMMALLQRQPGSCARMLGNPAAFCDDKKFSNYNPYSSDQLNSTTYPFAFINSIAKDIDHSLLNMSDITMNAENFAIWGHEDLPVKYTASGRYNSGEDVQSYAGAGWLPFISEIRFKDTAILNYTGYFIANALLSSAYETSEDDIKNMKNIQMLSIYGQRTHIDGMKDYLEKYTETMEPFGCRSKLTCRELKARRIKSYFSACLTLTMDVQGGLLGRREKSLVYNELLNPNAIESVPEKNKIVLVDVQDPNVVPKIVWDSPNAIHLKANIHASYPSLTTKMGTFGYAYKLLSTYAREAKVIITSRIHVGLPAAALGVPVIFVESSNGWLPGGRQKVGRVEGLLDIFHRVQAGDNSKNWTYGNLDGEIPHSNGVHLADRYRASFWHRLKKTDFYDDAARLYGMIPLKRLGRKNVKIDMQDKFHFVLSQNDLGWQTRRAIEHVFFFHPNCRVFVHSNDIHAGASDLDIFVESGYDLSVQKYDSKSLKDEFSSSDLPIVFSILFKYGGVFLSKNTLLAKEMSASLEEGLVLDSDGNAAMAFYYPHSNEIALKVLHSVPPSWSFPVLSDVETQKCANDPNWKLEGFGGSSSSSLAISLDASAYASFGAIKIDTECCRIVEEPCIYCDDLHWEY